MLATLALGLAAGLHGASYGAYKDSPHESFLLRRFVREILLSTTFAASFVLLGLDRNETPFILYLSFFALTRTATEFWKLFVRVEPQNEYRIPTQMHYVKGVVHNRALRLAFGIGFLASIYGIYSLGTIFTELPTPLRGLLVGLAIGSAEAIAGAYKDGSIEGFHLFKFFKSPTFGALGGLIASGHTGNIVSLLLAAIGTMRMLLELVFKMIVPSYVPGKFRSMDATFPVWSGRRRLFLMPYALTWALYLTLATRADWASVNVMAASTSRPATVGAAAYQDEDEAGTCRPPFAQVIERQYIVRGRVGPAPFWTGRHRVGAAQLTTSDSSTGDRHLALLIGTDLDRAPMRLNRWSYVAETVCGARSRLVSLTTEPADPSWLDHASPGLGGSSNGERLTAIRSSSAGGVIHTDRLRLASPKNQTYRELDAALRALPPVRGGERSDMPAHGDTGFLVALTGLIHEAVARDREGAGHPAVLDRIYTHDGKIYELLARATPAAGRASGQPLDVAFVIRDAAQESLASFDVTVGTAGNEAEVPLRVVYRPHWWLELELLLTPRSGGN